MTDQEPTTSAVVERNSESHGVFLSLASDPGVSFAVIELAGRGITAEAAATRWMLTGDKPTIEEPVLADKRAGLALLDDQLLRLWQAFRGGVIQVAELESGLEKIVMELETWPAPLLDPVADSSSGLSRDMP